MVQKTNTFAVALEAAQVSREAEVVAAANQAHGFIQSIDRAKLNPQDQQDLDSLGQSLNTLVQGFQQSDAVRRTDAAERIAVVKKLKLFSTLSLVAAPIVGFILLFLVWPLGLILIIGGIIAGIVLKNRATKQAEQLAQEARGMAESALTQIGRPDTEVSPATGLCARADTLFLSTLDQTALMIENQRRATNRQMAQMKAQHEAQMAQQQKQMQQQQAAMEALIDENQATKDALFGKPGVIGTAMRTRDKIKRNQ